ncbi:MAG TPA: hypothetical protein VG309_04245 [Rhizomicrobium sp.]|jgi:hypothetical protein|nr:hypothetical protein [Rhizomicrobium sp.]
MEEDDLPPKRETDVEDRSFFESLGELFGATVWIGLFVVVVGGIAYLLLHYL